MEDILVVLVPANPTHTNKEGRGHGSVTQILGP